MRTLDQQTVIKSVSKLCMDANYYIGQDVAQAYQDCQANETSDLGRDVLGQIIENARIAREQDLPLCQDTGFAVFFVELGRDLKLDFDLEDAINQGVRQGYQDGYLRKSIVKDPLNRVNTGDNTPAIVHLTLVPGDQLTLTIAPKGGGAENMSQLKMLAPADGLDGVKQFIVDVVRKAGSNACPPLVVGVGIGGTFEKAAFLAKRSLLRDIGSSNESPFYNDLEKELLDSINQLGIGPMGLGGRTTALGVFISTHPCHIASLPVAVNIQCHSARHKTVVIGG